MAGRRIGEWQAVCLLLHLVEQVERLVEILDPGIKGRGVVHGDQRTAHGGLVEIVIHIDGQACGLEGFGNHIGRFIGVLGQRGDAFHLLALDGAQRLVDGDEKSVGLICR